MYAKVFGQYIHTIEFTIYTWSSKSVTDLGWGNNF